MRGCESASTHERSGFGFHAGFSFLGGGQAGLVEDLVEDGDVGGFVCVAAAHDGACLGHVFGFLDADEPHGVVGALDPPVGEFVEHGEEPRELLDAGGDVRVG